MLKNNTRQLLKKEGMTQREFAERMLLLGYEGIHQSAYNSISDFAMNKGKSRRDDMIEYICKILEVSVGDILEIIND